MQYNQIESLYYETFKLASCLKFDNQYEMVLFTSFKSVRSKMNDFDFNGASDKFIEVFNKFKTEVDKLILMYNNVELKEFIKNMKVLLPSYTEVAKELYDVVYAEYDKLVEPKVY